MAISLVAAPQAAIANNGGTATITWSTRPSEGDVTYCIVGSPASTPQDCAMVTAGYTRIAYHTGAAEANPSIAIFRKVQGSTTDTTVAAVADSSARTDTVILGYCFRGVDTTTPEDAAPTTAGETTSTNPDPAAIDIATEGAAVLVAACMTVVMDTSPGTISGYDAGGYVSEIGNDTADHTLAGACILGLSTGSHNPGAWSSWSSGLWYAITVAIRPAIILNHYSLPIASGSFSLSGSATALKQTRKLAVGSGAFTLTGSAVAVKKDLKLFPVSGSYTLLGQAVVLKQTRRIDIASGSFALTGSHVDLAQGVALNHYNLPIGSGAFILAGQGVNLKKTLRLIPVSGGFSLSGQSLVLKQTRKLIPASGSFILSGQAIGLSQGRRLVPATTAFSLTGQAVGLRHTRKLNISSGVFSLTGSALALAKGYMLPISSGSFALAGSAISLKQTRKIGIVSGAFSLTGSHVDLIQGTGGHYTLPIKSGSFTLNGLPITLLSKYQMPIKSGAFNLSGSHLNLVYGRGLAIKSGVFNLLGQSLSMKATRLLSIKSGEFDFLGSGLELILNKKLTEPINSLVHASLLDASSIEGSSTLHSFTNSRVAQSSIVTTIDDLPYTKITKSITGLSQVKRTN